MARGIELTEVEVSEDGFAVDRLEDVLCVICVVVMLSRLKLDVGIAENSDVDLAEDEVDVLSSVVPALFWTCRGAKVDARTIVIRTRLERPRAVRRCRFCEFRLIAGSASEGRSCLTEAAACLCAVGKRVLISVRSLDARRKSVRQLCDKSDNSNNYSNPSWTMGATSKIDSAQDSPRDRDYLVQRLRVDFCCIREGKGFTRIQRPCDATASIGLHEECTACTQRVKEVDKEKDSARGARESTRCREFTGWFRTPECFDTKLDSFDRIGYTRKARAIAYLHLEELRRGRLRLRSNGQQPKQDAARQVSEHHRACNKLLKLAQNI